MENSIRLRLLGGDFICETSDPVVFRNLTENDAARETLDKWLRAVDRRLARTSGGSAFYATWSDSSQADPQTVRAQMEAIVKKNPVIWRFLEVIQAASVGGVEIGLSAGDRVELAPLAHAVSANESLRIRLSRASSALNATAAGTDIEMLRRACEFLEKGGFLVSRDKGRSLWFISGKIEWLHDLTAFIKEHAPADAFPQDKDEEREALRAESRVAIQKMKGQDHKGAPDELTVEINHEEAEDSDPLREMEIPRENAGPVEPDDREMGAQSAGAGFAEQDENLEHINHAGDGYES